MRSGADSWVPRESHLVHILKKKTHPKVLQPIQDRARRLSKKVHSTILQLRAHPNVNGGMSSILHKIRRHQELQLELESCDPNACTNVFRVA